VVAVDAAVVAVDADAVAVAAGTLKTVVVTRTLTAVGAEDAAVVEAAARAAATDQPGEQSN
jgi:hypothetical protein